MNEEPVLHWHHWERIGEPLRWRDGHWVYLWTCTGKGACGATKEE